MHAYVVCAYVCRRQFLFTVYVVHAYIYKCVHVCTYVCVYAVQPDLSEPLWLASLNEVFR